MDDSSKPRPRKKLKLTGEPLRRHRERKRQSQSLARLKKHRAEPQPPKKHPKLTALTTAPMAAVRLRQMTTDKFEKEYVSGLLYDYWGEVLDGSPITQDDRDAREMRRDRGRFNRKNAPMLGRVSVLVWARLITPNGGCAFVLGQILYCAGEDRRPGKNGRCRSRIIKGPGPPWWETSMLRLAKATGSSRSLANKWLRKLVELGLAETMRSERGGTLVRPCYPGIGAALVLLGRSPPKEYQ